MKLRLMLSLFQQYLVYPLKYRVSVNRLYPEPHGFLTFRPPAWSYMSAANSPLQYARATWWPPPADNLELKRNLRNLVPGGRIIRLPDFF